LSKDSISQEEETSSNENGYTREKNINASEIRSKHYDPLKWFIPGILPEGLAILAGEEKAGKSFLALQWAIEASILYKVAYIALEDGGRRIKDR
jgi:predicted ATP-dependent serine protease